MCVERARLSKYSISKKLHDQAFRLVEAFVQGAIVKWDEYLSTAIDFMPSRRFPDVTGSVMIADRTDRVSNPTSVARGGRGRRSRTTCTCASRNPLPLTGSH